jgi:hypothetical protein
MANRHMPHASGVLTTYRAPGLRTEARAVSDAGLPTVARGPECVRERRLERETGIEPATNSLEGCDSTTELLPPIPRASFPKPDSRTTIPTRFRVDVRLRASADNLRSSTARSRSVGLPTEARSMRRGRRLVAREGLEPSKPLGRQIYSLLRLTASLPRQLSVLECVRPVLPCGLCCVQDSPP